MGMVLPMNYAEIEQEEMMYLEGGKVSSKVYYNRTGYQSLYVLAAAFGANAAYGGGITVAAAASGIGIPLATVLGATTAFQGWLASILVRAGSDAEVLYNRYGKYRIVTTTLLGIPTGIRAEKV